jgi:hypothetical protein
MGRLVGVSIALSGILLAIASGCGKATNEVQVSGRATVDGVPIPSGAISFVDVGGTAATGGGIIKDGSYSATVLPGEKIVLVLGQKLVGQEPEYEGVPDSPMRDKYEVITPPAYDAAHLSPLKATISGPQDGLDFDLTGKPPTRR